MPVLKLTKAIGVCMNILSFGSFVVVALLAPALTACGGKGHNDAATQVAAKVNGGEITVHQVNFALQRNTNLSTPGQLKDASHQVLDRLIEQELLVQAATEKKLDRDPRVVQAIEAARREVIARAYLEQLATSGMNKPSEQEIHDYYAKHPALFSERRIYNFKEVAVENNAGMQQKVRAELAKSSNLDDLSGALKAESIRYVANSFVKPAEQLPLDALAGFHSMKDGDVKVSATPQAVVVLQLAGSRSEPVDETKARPAIELFLANQRRADVAKAEIKHLRDSAEIELVGEFATTATVAETSVGTGTTPIAASRSESLEKGIKGLK